MAVGPLTNLALALQHDPGITKLVKEVVIMGGAFGVNGHQAMSARLPKPISMTIPRRLISYLLPTGPW